jgi:hypothetical protein
VQAVLSHSGIRSKSSFHDVTQSFLEGARIRNLNRIPSKYHATGSLSYFVSRQLKSRALGWQLWSPQT